MANTVYSKKSKRELDKEQLKRLFNDNFLDDKDCSKNVVHTAAGCPVCNVSGANFVSNL